MKMRCHINEKLELVTRDGVTIGKVETITLDIDADALRGTIGGEGFGEEQTSDSEKSSSVGGVGEGQLFESKSDRVLLAEHWALRSGRELRLSDPKVKRVLDNALKARDLETCKRAIDGLFADPWWRENVRPLELRHALRGNTTKGESDADRIDKMAEKAPHNVSSLEAYLRTLDEPTRENVVARMRNAARDIREEMDPAAPLAFLAQHGIRPTITDGRLTGWSYGEEAA
jgi:hypothetical protein